MSDQKTIMDNNRRKTKGKKGETKNEPMNIADTFRKKVNERVDER